MCVCLKCVCVFKVCVPACVYRDGGVGKGKVCFFLIKGRCLCALLKAWGTLQCAAAATTLLTALSRTHF